MHELYTLDNFNWVMYGWTSYQFFGRSIIVVSKLVECLLAEKSFKVLPDIWLLCSTIVRSGRSLDSYKKSGEQVH